MQWCLRPEFIGVEIFRQRKIPSDAPFRTFDCSIINCHQLCPSRLLNISSSEHYESDILWVDMNLEDGSNALSKVYGQSKFAQI